MRANPHSDKRNIAFHFVNTGDAGAVFLLYRNASTDAPAPTRSSRRSVWPITCRQTRTVRSIASCTARTVSSAVSRAPNAQHAWWSRDEADPEVKDGYDVANGNLQLNYVWRITARRRARSAW